MNKGIFCYEMHVYVKSGKSMVPVICYAAWLGLAYGFGSGTVDVLGSYGMCALVNFIVMTAIGTTFANRHDQMIEMVFLTRLRKKEQLYMSHLLLIYAFSAMLAAAGILIPLLFYILGGFVLYSRCPGIADVAAGGGAMFLTGACGGVIGLFSNGRIIGKREGAILLEVFFPLLTLIKTGLGEQAPVLKYLLYVLPPVSDLAVRFNKMEFFVFRQGIGLILWMVIYVFVISGIYVRIMLSKRME